MRKTTNVSLLLTTLSAVMGLLPIGACDPKVLEDLPEGSFGNMDTDTDSDNDSDSDSTEDIVLGGSLIETCVPELINVAATEARAFTVWDENAYSMQTSYEYYFDENTNTYFTVTAYEALGAPQEPGEFDVTDELAGDYPAGLSIQLHFASSDGETTKNFEPVTGIGSVTFTAIQYGVDGSEFSGCVDIVMREIDDNGEPCSGTLEHCWNQRTVLENP